MVEKCVFEIKKLDFKIFININLFSLIELFQSLRLFKIVE